MRSVTPTFNLPIDRTALVAAAVLAMFGLLINTGCTQLRLPQIDPTGECLFAPYPENSTAIAPDCGCVGCIAGEECCLARLFSAPCKCLSGEGCGLCCIGSGLPEPAFPEPAPPPPCETPSPAAAPETCLPAPGCEACRVGPPAVLLGCEAEPANFAKLPRRGKRGCILLSPQRIVAPVDGEVILLSGVCGDDGYLMQREPLEWMLTPESVGHIIDVGDDDPGLLHRLTKTPKVDKRSGSYARGVTSTKKALITRGNQNPNDDVRLEKGQTWLSISSPTEGTSRVTVLAPESECWDQRKATATIYWIDAQWDFPRPQTLAAGTPTELTTRVTRSEGAIPAKGWIVRYEILNPEGATFLPDNAPVAEAVVDESGNATVQIAPLDGAAGTANVAVTVIRPAGESDNMPRMTLGRGQTTVTWSAPKLRVRAGAPEVAGFEKPFPVAAQISNPGTLPAENVRVTLELPPGVGVESTDSFARVLGNQIVWEIDRIPAQQQWEIQASLTARSTVVLPFVARGEPNLLAEDQVQVDIYQPALELRVDPQLNEDRRPEVGEEVTFNIDVINIGDRPLNNVKLEAVGDDAMIQLQEGTPQVFKDKEDGPLQPGEANSWPIAVTYVPTQPGQRCLTVRATADGGQQATATSCVIAINPVPETPTLTARIESLPVWRVGDNQVIFKYKITNPGREPLTGVRVTASYDPQLEVQRATVSGRDDSEIDQYKLNWVIPRLEPRSEALVEAEFRAVAPNRQALMVLTASSENGATAGDDFRFQIVPGQAPATPPPDSPSDLGPANPPPSIPPARNENPQRGPPADPPPPPANIAPPIAAEDDGQLEIELFALDNPAEVGRPARFQLVLRNNRPVPDSQVIARFALPPGTRVERIRQTTNPDGQPFKPYAGLIYLPEIRQLTAGETITFTIVLVSNQPQTLELQVEANSRLSEQAVSATERVRILPP